MRSQRRFIPKVPKPLQISSVPDSSPPFTHSQSSNPNVPSPAPSSSLSHSHQPLTPASPLSSIERRSSYDHSLIRSDLHNFLHINELISSNVPGERL